MLRGKHWTIIISWLFIMSLTLMSLTAELWSNNKPLIMSYRGKLLSPIFKVYYPTELGIVDRLDIDYKQLKFGLQDWAIWPINQWGPFESNKRALVYPSPPTGENWLGTDDRGRDILARLVYGFRYSMIYAVAVCTLCLLLALVFGSLTGFFGGWIDLLGQRAIELLSTVPALFLLIFLLSLFEPNMLILIVVSSALGWTGLSYFIRGEALKTRKQDFVEAARACGASPMRILFRHVLPNCLGPLLTFTPFMIIANITGLAMLDFLGFGLPPPTPSWGELLQQGQSYFATAWWLAVFPSLALFLVLFSITLIGEDLRLRI